MKKILSVILAAAALFTLAACKVKPSENKETEPYRPEEFQAQVSQLQAERASELAEQQKEKDKLNKEIDDYIAEIGKTKKGKELVLEISSSRGREYQKYVFNKKGEIDYRLDYMFYNSTEDYDSCLRVVKNDEYRKVVEKDSKILMVVVKYTDPTQSTFDELYGTYSKPEVIALGYKIVE
ncbi:MAG: hypothetical protein U0M02_09775 [Acutalibacteraceae bacterium]|nr:hypothetical protein [Acutalibacteraceae bacterium]